MIGLIRRFWLVSWALAVVLAASHMIWATTVVMPADDDMIIGARAIVRAKVLSVSSSFDQERGMVFTYVALRVREVLKGQISARRIVIKEAGGATEDYMTVIHGAPQFSPDEEVILYLGTWPDGSLRTYQMFLGKFSIKPDPETGKLIAKRDDPGPYVDIIEQPGELNPSASGGRRVVTNRMELAAYIDMVRRRVAETRQRSEEFQRIHYNGAPLLYEPPEYAEKEMSGQLHPQYSLLGPMRWFEPDKGQPVVFYVKPDGAPTPNILSDVAAAAAAWSSVPGASIRLSIGGTTTQCRETIGTNTIRFDNCDGLFQPGDCSAVLALGGGSWTSETKVVNGTTFRRMVSGFVSLNPFASCFFSNPCNVQEVLTHELGHAIGLDHSSDSDATMYFRAHFDGRCASLRQDDQNGAVFIYPGSGGGGGQPAITSSSPLPSGTVGTAYSFTFSATGGTPPYTWSLVSGSLPPGLNLSSSGQLSGTPSSAGSYSFTVRVTDSASQSAQKDFSLLISSSSPTPGLDSQFISQNVPTTVQAGQPFNVSMVWLNTGSQVWSEANQVRIGSQNPPNNITWGGNRVILPSSTQVGPGQQLSVTFTAFAPSTPGNYNFQWQMVKEGVGFFGQISPNVVITVTGGFSITTTQLPAGTVGVEYRAELSAAGGTPPYAWSLVSGSLPPGLNLTSGGVISGTPATVGNFTFTVGVTDSQSRSAQKQLSLRINSPLSIQSPSLLEATVGIAFSHQLVASGGTPPYSWQLISGQLPGGLSLNSSSGVISGTPSFAGTFPFIVQVTDSASQTAQKSMQIRVAQQPFSVTTESLGVAIKGRSYSQQLSAAGGTPPYTWSLASGSLPPGLALNASTGLISGTPTQKGTFSFVVAVRDQSQQSSSRQLQLLVVGPGEVPSIINIKYKPGSAKLIIVGENFDPAARVFVNDQQASPRFIEPTRIVIKPMQLAPGNYEVRVINPNGVASNAFRVTVN